MVLIQLYYYYYLNVHTKIAMWMCQVPVPGYPSTGYGIQLYLGMHTPGTGVPVQIVPGTRVQFVDVPGYSEES